MVFDDIMPLVEGKVILNMNHSCFSIDQLVGVISKENSLRNIDVKLGYFFLISSPLLSFNNGLKDMESGFDFFVLVVIFVEKFGENFGGKKFPIFGVFDGRDKFIFGRSLKGRGR